MSEEKKPTPSTNIPLLSYQKSEQQDNFHLKTISQKKITALKRYLCAARRQRENESKTFVIDQRDY